MVVVALGPSATVHLLSPVRLRWPASHSIAATPHCIACIGSVKWKWGGIAHLQLQMLLAGLDWPDSTPLVVGEQYYLRQAGALLLGSAKNDSNLVLDLDHASCQVQLRFISCNTRTRLYYSPAYRF